MVITSCVLKRVTVYIVQIQCCCAVTIKQAYERTNNITLKENNLPDTHNNMSAIPPIFCQASWPALPSTTAAQSQTPIKPLSVTQAATSSQSVTQPRPHPIFVVPELLIGVLSALPLKDLRNCYRVLSWWREVIHAHMPPDKIPLPGHVDISDNRIGGPTGAPSEPVLIHSALFAW